jgi:hypothetical protein
MDEATHATLTRATVAFLLEARRQYLATGASPLKHWDQMTSRLNLTPQTCVSVEEMATRYLRDLRVEAPSKDCSSAILSLQRVVNESVAVAVPDPAPRGYSAERARARVWLDFVERESAFLIASAREIAEQRRADRLAHVTPHPDADPAVRDAVEAAIRAQNEEMA